MRYVALWASFAGTVVFALLMLWDPAVFLIPLVICAVLSAIGIRDATQTRHSIKRNYPILPRDDPAGDPPVLPRERHRRDAIQPLQPLDRLSARQGRSRQATVRHA